MRGNKTGRSRDFLSILINPKFFDPPLSEEELIDQTLTFLVAGHETTANLLAWASWMLAKETKFQDELYSELQRTGLSGQSDLAADYWLNQLPMQAAYLNETLRYFSIVPTLFRQTRERENLGNFSAPENSTLAISNFLIHRNEVGWGQSVSVFDTLGSSQCCEFAKEGTIHAVRQRSKNLHWQDVLTAGG